MFYYKILQKQNDTDKDSSHRKPFIVGEQIRVLCVRLKGISEIISLRMAGLCQPINELLLLLRARCSGLFST